MPYQRLAVILGHCLFNDHQRLAPDEQTLFFMAEDAGLCQHFRYHKHKLILFLSAMRSHADEVRKKYPLVYHRLSKSNFHTSYEDKLTDCLKEHPQIRELQFYVIEDKFFDKRIYKFCQDKHLKISIVDSPAFINTQADFQEYTDRSRRPFMHNFYKEQRKKLGVLIEADGSPSGGSWSYDSENRKKLPRDIFIPPLHSSEWTAHTKEVIPLVDSLFAEHPGQSENFHWATTRPQALERLDDFFKNRFLFFGPYEDAIDSQRNFLFHSVLSPYINLGLLTPDEVVEKAIAFADANEVSLPSLEGYVRQVIGWREFMRGMYHTHELRGNFFGHERKLGDCWYKGTTGVPPLDHSIKRVLRDAYTHHIERLMVLGNIMLLAEVHPDEVYRWFMELFIDSSDWVMVPNVYGMSQFADGGTFATKPYIGGANYIAKMSDYRKKGNWADEIDGLYWRFIDRNRELFASNPRMSMMVSLYEKMDDQKRNKLMQAAENFIDRTTSN
ncbi:MAG: cryptochrome/photolyase family protein [Cyclobacteriaceae bacterium]